MALQVFSEVFSEKKTIKSKNLAPGTCMLQSSLRDKARMGRECFRAKIMWVGPATC